jgi:hypothetical protein
MYQTKVAPARAQADRVFNQDAGLLDATATLGAMPVARCKLIWLSRRPPKHHKQEPMTNGKRQPDEVNSSG